MRNYLPAAVAAAALTTPAMARDKSVYVGVDAGVMLVEDTNLDFNYDYDAEFTYDIDDAFTIDHKLGFDVDLPWRELSRKERDWLLFTDDQPVVPVYPGYSPAEVKRALKRREPPD